MSEAEQTKTCPACAEVIKAAAKICPHCRTKQVRFALLRLEAGIAFVVLVLLVEWIVMAVIIAPVGAGEGRSFVGHQSELKIERVSLEATGKLVSFHVSGVVTNAGRYPWRIRQLEVRFVGPQGELVEVRHHDMDEPFVVQPAHEAAFRFPVERLIAEVVTAKLEARVQNATDGKRERDRD